MPYVEKEPQLIGTGYGCQVHLIEHEQQGQCVAMSPPNKVRLTLQTGHIFTITIEGRSTAWAINCAMDIGELYGDATQTPWKWRNA